MLRKQFFKNKGELEERKQISTRVTLYCDEEVNALAKGKPSMTAQFFCVWVNEHLLPSSHLPPHFPRRISFCTAVRWLHHLGFKPVSHQKGVYIDVHKREDVVRHRGVYLHTMVALRASHQPPPVCSDEQPRVRIEGDEQKKRLVIIYHDNQSTTVMRGRRGCGRRKRDQLSCRRRRGVVQWCRTSWKNTSVFCTSDDQYRREKVGSPSISQLTRVAFEYGSECGGYWTGKIFLTNEDCLQYC